jgi:hypothetical protein
MARDGYDDGHNDDTAPSPFERPVLCAECLTTPLDGPKGGVCDECAGQLAWDQVVELDANECEWCLGTGETNYSTGGNGDPVVDHDMPCPECNGTGQRDRITLHQPVVSAPTCDECGGTGEAS